MEYLDIYDENDQPLGYQEERKTAHEKQLFHRAVHIWLVNKDKKVILQKRSSFKDVCPNMWDISSAGHVLANESLIAACQRELYEELGIKKKEEDFIFIGKVRIDGKRNKEFGYVYIVYDDRKLADYHFKDHEVSKVQRTNYHQLNEYLNIVKHDDEFKLLADYLDQCNLIKDSNHLYHLSYNVETDRPNLYLIKGEKYNIAVDAGNSKSHQQIFKLALKFKKISYPKYTIISHWHWDHTFGINACGNKVICSQKTAEYLNKVAKWSWNLEAMQERLNNHEEIQFCHDNILKEYPNLNDINVLVPKYTINEDKTFDLGDIKVKVIVKESTHSLDSIFVYLESDKALIVEDADCPDYYHNEVYDLERLNEMIKFFKQIDYKYHYLGHAQRESKSFALKRLNQVKLELR